MTEHLLTRFFTYTTVLLAIALLFLFVLDSFRFCLAMGPVAIYLLLLGGINLSRRPFVVSGTRDAAALALALSGFAIIGPIDLFLPEAAAMAFGPYVWLFLISLYTLCLLLVLLMARPRLIVYNISADELHSVLADLAVRLDPDAHWAGESLSLKNLGVQLHVHGVTSMRNMSLVGTSLRQNYLGWRRLEESLRDEFSRVEVARNPYSTSLISGGLLLTGILVAAISRDPQSLFKSLFDLLRLS